MIEKNIRLQPHHSRDLLVGRRSDGKRPKYQPPSQGGGFANTGGGGGGGGGEYADRHPPVYVAPVTTAVAPPSILAKEPPKDTRGDTPDRIAEQIILDKIQKKEKEKFERAQDYMDLKAKAPTTFKPKIEEYITHSPFTDEPIINERVKKYYSPPYDPETDPNALLKRPGGIMSKIGGGLKKVFGDNPLEWGVNALSLGGYQKAKYAKALLDIKNRKGIYGTALGLGEKLTGKKLSNLTSTIDKAAKLRSRPKDMPEHLGERGFRTRDDTPTRDGEAVNRKTLAETITGGAGLQSGQEMLGLDDEQIKNLYAVQNVLNTTIDAGVYQGQQLTADQIKLLQNKQMELNKLIEAIEKAKAPVNVAHGGRIDSPLPGRNRYI